MRLYSLYKYLKSKLRESSIILNLSPILRHMFNLILKLLC